MNNNSLGMLNSIMEALMSISTKGNDTITMANVLQALQGVIEQLAAEPETPNNGAAVMPPMEFQTDEEPIDVE